MRRDIVLKDFIKCIGSDDIKIFSGANLSLDAFKYDDKSFLYIENSGSALSIAMGIAINTSKKVFVFCGDGDLLREFSLLPQIAVSKCKNIIIVALNNGVYQSLGGFYSIFNEIPGMKGVIVKLGMMVFDFTKHFSLKDKTLKNLIQNISGPAFVIINIEAANSVYNNNIDFKYVLNRFKAFIIGEEIING